MNDNVKKIFSGSEIGALIEDFDHKMDIVAEGIAMVNEKLDMEVVGLKEFIRSEITALRVEIKDLYKTKADHVKVEALEQRVAALERLIGKNVKIDIRE